jgi:peptidyl-dipeptidase Dcp
MLKKRSLPLVIAGILTSSLIVSGCSEQKDSAQIQQSAAQQSDAEVSSAVSENPFFENWNTPFGAPPFEQIEVSHFKEAFNTAMTKHLAQIDAIATADSLPTFDNTISEMERSGAELSRVSRVFFNLVSTESSDEMQALQREFSPALTRHSNTIQMNGDLFDRISSIYSKRNESDLNAEQIRLTERIYNDFVRSGADLKGEDRERFAKINERISSLTTQFGQNVLNDTRAFKLVLEETDLDGLPKSLIEAASAQAESQGLTGQYVITLQRSSVQPFLQFSERRDLREKAFKGWALRGDNDNEFDNKAIVEEIVNLRAERAKLLGYEHHSDYVLSNAMAKTPEAAMELLMDVWEPAVAKAEQEKQWILELMAEQGTEHDFEAWDWRYYAEQVRLAKFNLDEAEISQYFELENMLNAQFYVAERLFGLSFVERNDIPVYNPVVRVWEVKDAQGEHLGLFYGDFYARDSKRSGAWMSAFRVQQKLAGDITAQVTNNMNLNQPAPGEPTLMSYSDAVTLFHEFGHALHGLLSNVTYPTLSGTSVPRDWVEFPAQIYEHFIAQPYMLQKFALHYETGEPMPQVLLDRIMEARTFNQGFATIEYTASALVDMAYHKRSEISEIDVRQFEDEVLGAYGKPEEIIMRHRSTHFGHIFSGGYHSAYYAYMWSEILDADGFDAFTETGDIFDKDTAKRLQDFVFSTGDKLDYLEAYTRFRGRAPTTDSLLRNRGLLSDADAE